MFIFAEEFSRFFMEALYRTHDFLLRNMRTTIRRGLADSINPQSSIVGILGARGVGKTTFLLEYARELYGAYNRKCLYVNLNQFRFTTETLSSFSDRFVEHGGRVLLLDQIYKYPGWQQELRDICSLHRELRVIYAGSSLLYDTAAPIEMQLPGEVYHLPGFSLREFINIQTGHKLPTISYPDLVRYHKDFSRTILESVNPVNWFSDYVHHGYFPFFLEPSNYSENLLKNLNMMLEVDVMYIRSIDQKLLPKLRKLLFLLAQSAPEAPNISQLATNIETSRATVTNYMHILSDANLITQLYRANEDENKKPSRCYMQNTNLSYVLMPESTAHIDTLSTFFLNQMSGRVQIEAGSRAQVHFVVQGDQLYRIDKEPSGKYKPDRFYAVNGINSGERNVIPLWCFGFLY